MHAGVQCASYHAGMKGAARAKVLTDWTAGCVRCVAATVAFGMGIDRAAVRLVVHYNLPKTLEGFYQVSIAPDSSRRCLRWACACLCTPRRIVEHARAFQAQLYRQTSAAKPVPRSWSESLFGGAEQVNPKP